MEANPNKRSGQKTRLRLSAKRRSIPSTSQSADDVDATDYTDQHTSNSFEQPCEKNELRLRWAVSKAITHRKDQKIPLKEKIELLKGDIDNSLSHVFGEHKECKAIGYFCEKPYNPSGSLLSDLKMAGKYIENESCSLRRSRRQAPSLIYDVDNNRVEMFNSIIAKFTGGKTINYCQRRSYQSRCAAAVVSLNTRKPIYTIKKYLSLGKSPGKYTKRLEFRSKKIIPTARRKLNFTNKGKTRNVECDKSYGENCEKPDMSPEDFKIEPRTFLEQLAKTEGEIQEIQTQTKNQRESDIWYLERRNRLTASTFGEVCKRRNTTSCKSLVERIRYPRPLYARSIEWVPYEPMVMALENSGVDLTSDFVKSKLIQKDIKLDKSEREVALATKSKPYNKGFILKCYKCHQQEHKASKRNSKNEKQNKGKPGYKSHDKSKNDGNHWAMFFALTTKTDASSWYIDSGCPNHTTGRKECLVKTRVDMLEHEITLANNKKLQCHEIGDTSININNQTVVCSRYRFEFTFSEPDEGKGFEQSKSCRLVDPVTHKITNSRDVVFLLALAVELALDIDHLDVKTSFLNGDLNEKVYMEQPEDFIVKGQENKPAPSPLDPNLPLVKEDSTTNKSSHLPYQVLVGCLMYLAVACRLDIAYAASVLSQFNPCYNETHWTAAKRVLQYLKGTMNLCLVFERGEER
ncbi:hypothetical protein ILUMI_04197 [Ignelater luminosus]|uniref:Retrovirus-related Pol polyprotein from transposon TNT 1-94 n=1 Tax=Ignelater luminosus TaxID=2038154 RepID=A0A8K0DF68_IGNLU|nr:hypothetical protein ILUMI_04197 [Ignelater luminosus]